MHLKALTLRGFKTFSDLTEVEFNQAARITAVVGPNGCGKSNLLDAVRWVMGEDNPHLLRVDALEKIIFAGTSDRQPLSLAEVSVIFDNTDGKLPIPYTEVALRRRTFRGGESEFSINKTVCRLKDIKDLLMDTGLGEGTYAIITQGQVDAILSSKGEDRRIIFEEAAGVNKYKTRKVSAERKLIAAEQNILRINDLKIEVSEQLLVLEEQARKAREYQGIQTRVKELEIGFTKKALALLLEKKAKIDEELTRAKLTSDARQAEEKKFAAELETSKESLRQLELGIDELAVKLDEEKDRLRDVEINRRFLEGELRREEAILSELEEKKRHLQQKIDSLEQADSVGSGQTSSNGSLKEAVSSLIEQIRHLIGLLADLSVFLGLGEMFSLVEPKEKEAARALQLELLREEGRRFASEVDRIRFSLQAHRLDSENLAGSPGQIELKFSFLEQLQKLKQEREALRSKILQLEEKVRVEEKNERSAGSLLSSLEVAAAKVEGEMSALSEKLLAEYNLTLPEIESSPHSVPNAAKAKLEIEEGKNRLRALEPVNLLAIEEFDRTRDRLSFIEAQLADLVSARENLRNLIIELDQKAEEAFCRTMQQISIVFSETFAKLFAGGEAKIELAPNISPFEAEIEISIRPAGRRWLPLSLLSGGERSLCAIAILFSLLKIRPSPFCFLDEVDAALDEANIGRFTELLKSFSQNSQMIVISHNKRTMASADAIYGITMQSPGISSVISMELAKTAV